jgi:hypothetical protein
VEKKERIGEKRGRRKGEEGRGGLIKGVIWWAEVADRCVVVKGQERGKDARRSERGAVGGGERQMEKETVEGTEGLGRKWRVER